MRTTCLEDLSRAFACSSLIAALAGSASAQQSIWVHPSASMQEVFAAREVERYVYLRTGRLLPIQRGNARRSIIVARKDHLPSRTKANRGEGRTLLPQQYLLAGNGQSEILIVGGDNTGVLYGAYRFAERLGVRFYLHGDTIPDFRIALRLPKFHELGRPLFALRGIQPFHDFPEGPDWWNRDDYLAVIGQLPKLRMNFIGLHTYPEGGVGPEPEVWIGQPSDVAPNGDVTFAYPSSWANTLRPGSWGYVAAPTSRFSCGLSQLFEGDDFGPAVMEGAMPRPQTLEDSIRLFNDAGAMLRDAFAEAHALGVKTCVGTETPLTVPKLVQDRLRAQGEDPGSLSTVRRLYEGMFTRIARAFPVDYYWLWTPEDWTWSGNSAEQFKRTADDMQAALSALASIGQPFKLATCGWVLGPQNDRAALDRVLPKSVPVSTINQSVGNAPVEPGFAKIASRSKWAIPWMENDPGLTELQLWVGRMLYDAADAKRLGCDGLFGIHWRTKNLAPNVAALALAGWDQSWVPAGFAKRAADLTMKKLPATGAIGGNLASFEDPVSNTADVPLYQSVRYDMAGYDIAIPNGSYTVVLKFNEPFYTQSGKRVFGVKLQGKAVIDRLDVFERVGHNHALDFTFPAVVVKDGHLRADFVKQVEFPCIAAIVVTNGRVSRKINCGGPAYRDYIGEIGGSGPGDPQRRGMPIAGFYEDFARANFGSSVARQAGAIFASIDGMNLPRPADWITGPGDIRAESTPWSEVSKGYSFVDAFAALRPKVKGLGNLERFDYWLNTFRYQRAMGRAGVTRGKLNLEMSAISAEKSSVGRRRLAEQALKTRIQLARDWEKLIGFLEATVSTRGEFGTISNLEQHVRMNARFLDGHDVQLAEALGHALPSEAGPSAAYQGPPRIIVPTVRTSATPSERLTLDVILAGPQAPTRGTLYWRAMGAGPYAPIPLSNVGRRVYRASLPAFTAKANAVEYYIRADFPSGSLVYPPTAPTMGQTVVVRGQGSDRG